MILFDKNILSILVCPLTHQYLRYNEEKQELISKAAQLAYPIIDGVPIMIVEQARELDADDIDFIPVTNDKESHTSDI